MRDKVKIMFLCTGNSCRSQMAEGLAKQYPSLEVYSAGLKQQGINPAAIEIMREIGCDISRQSSDPIDQALLATMDYVITLCDNAAERCPTTPASVHRLHWPLADPANATGSPEQVKEAFRRVRDELAAKIALFIAQLSRLG